MLNEKERERQNRTFSLALQTLSPARLMTPSDQQSDPLIRDGVRLSEYGRPEGYWLATPKASPQSSFLSVERSALLSADFTYVPARVGHRPGVFHLFRHETDEQVRGVSGVLQGHRAVPQPVRRHQLRAVRAGHSRRRSPSSSRWKTAGCSSPTM